MGIPEKEIMDFIGELFKGFADPTRVHILYLLAEKELCVTDIAEAVDLSQSAISHQLRILKQMQLIKFRREGKNILYSLADDHVKTILEMGLEHGLEEMRKGPVAFRSNRPLLIKLRMSGRTVYFSCFCKKSTKRISPKGR